jgi:MFS family permease
MPLLGVSYFRAIVLTRSVRYGNAMSSTIKSRLSNSYLIGEIFGMLFFGVLIDRLGRRTGIVAATAFLVLGVVLATAAHGRSNLGYIYPPSVNMSHSNEM